MHITIQKFGVNINICIQQGHIKMIKSDTKDISNVTKDVYFNINYYYIPSFQVSWEKLHCFH